MAPTPSSPRTLSSSSSTHRLSSEYDGWWISSGVPIRRSREIASRVRSAEYEEMPAYRALPERTAVSSAPIVSSSGVSGSNRWE